MNQMEIQALLRSDQTALERAILAIYSQQTHDEQQTHHTRHWNNVGFNGPDSGKMSYYARWLQSGRRLSGKYLDDARERIMKYWGQLDRMGTFQKEAAHDPHS